MGSKGNSSSNNHSLQPENAQHVQPCRSWLTAAEDHTSPRPVSKQQENEVEISTDSQSEDWKNLGKLLISAATFRWSEFGMKNLKPSCLVSMGQAAAAAHGGGDVTVWRLLSWHIWTPLLATEHNLKASAYLSLAADHVPPCQQDNALCHKTH